MELKIEHLRKQFKDKTAVDDVSLTLTNGVWGLLGANGAGKTALMRMIADIMTPTSGTIYYDGTDIQKMGKSYRDVFGFLPQDFGYNRDFTVKDYLEYMAQIRNMGGLSSLLKMIPGVGGQVKEDMLPDDKQLGKIEAIIYSMTKEERGNPDLMNPSRKKRIAKGAGVDISEVNKLVKQFEQARKMMKTMPGMMGGKGKRKGGFKMPFGF